ncbi:LOW QUALITY PROTEIN: hypothetical protein LSH36_1392g00012, partial [Paralvinella palmiformis]
MIRFLKYHCEYIEVTHAQETMYACGLSISVINLWLWIKIRLHRNSG